MSLTISIDFAASIARLEEQSKRSADAVRQMADQMDSAASFARSALLGLAGAVSVTGFAAATRNAIDFADSLNDLALRTGTTVEMLSGLRLAAQLSDTSLEAVAGGTRKLASSLVENREAFQALGINTQNQTEALIQLGDVFAGMDDPVQRSALAVKVFGKSGEDLIPLLMQGSEGIRSMVEQGNQLAGVTAEMAARAAVFNDNLDILKIKTEGVFLTLADQLLPVLNETVTALNGVNGAGGATEAIGSGIATVFETIVVVGANVAYVFSGIGREIGGMAAQVAALASGDWEGFKAIGVEMKADAEAARKEIDAFTEKVLTARDRARSAAKEEQGSATGDNRGKDLLATLSGASAELEKLRQKDIDGWVKYADAVLAESEAIEAIERDRIIKENERQAASELAWQQGVAQRLAALQTAALSEEEIQRAKLLNIQTDLQFAHEQGWLTEQAYKEMLQQAELEHQARLGNIVAQGTLARQKFVQMSARQQTQTVLQEMLAVTNGVATRNRELFEINKVAGIANAVVSTYTGVSRTLAAYPYPWNLPMAALHLAAGLAQIDAISSAQFSTSTSAPSIGGGTATPVTDVGSSLPMTASAPVPEATQARSQVNVTLQGSQFSYQQVAEEIIPLINEAAGNGADIRVQYA